MAQSHDYIPKTDAALLIFSRTVYSYGLSNYARWQAPSPQILLLPPLTAYEGALETFQDPNHGKVDTLTKNEAKKELVAALRIYIQGYIARNPDVTDMDRERMSLPLRDTKPTPHPAPDVKPKTEAEPSGNGQHTVTAVNPQLGNRQKPPMVTGVAFAFKLRGINEPKAHAANMPSEYQAGAMKTFQWTEDDYGKVCDYATAYENESGKRGPWSDVVSMIIA